MKDSLSTKNQGIELLRVGAIIILILYHTSLIGGSNTGNQALDFFLAVSRMGWIGTDIFLAIAGYLSAISIFKRLNNNTDYLTYIKDRAIRIIPSYYLFLMLYLTLGIPLINSLGQNFNLNKGFGISLWTFISSYYFASGHWSGVALEGMFSLSIVVQLFVIFGFILFRVKSRKKLLYIMVFFELTAISLRFYWGNYDHWKTYFFPFTRMDSFITGIVVAILNDVRKEFLKRNTIKIFTISFLIIIITLLVTKGLTHGKLTTYFSYPAIAIFSGSLINITIQYKLSNKLLIYISKAGKLTYAIYLLKLPVVYFIFTIMNKYLLNFTKPINILLYILTSIAACIITGFVWWYITEKLKHAFTLPCSKSSNNI